jgi:hypothetical protein
LNLHRLVLKRKKATGFPWRPFSWVLSLILDRLQIRLRLRQGNTLCERGGVQIPIRKSARRH